MAHSYDVGTRAWQSDPTEGWVASEVQERLVDGDKIKLIFALENGEVCALRSPYQARRSWADLLCLSRPRQSRRLKLRFRMTIILPYLHL